jgi:D-beta-D-heptose 7-phosphate kinase / D-beta-D-heptose 1-phosphate adenosyltransferase
VGRPQFTEVLLSKWHLAIAGKNCIISFSLRISSTMLSAQDPRFSAKPVLIVGDIMLDRYWHGGTGRISPEAPVPVVHVQQTEDRPGGAGNVALNVQTLGANAHLLGMVGDDDAGTSLQQKFEAAAIQHTLLKSASQATITKLRVISQNQQMIRLDFEDALTDTHTPALTDAVQQALSDTAVMILSDYGKGTLQHPSDLIAMAREHDVPVFIDPKGKDFSRYRGATLLTPNRKEFELVVGACRDEAELVDKGLAAIDEYQLGGLLVTRGSEGMTLLQAGQEALHLPARAREVYDVTGAGDTVIAALACFVASGSSLAEAARWANLAASIAVGRAGTASVTLPELLALWNKQQGLDTGVMTHDQLMVAVAAARSQGERIVFTNGCFDLLHAGHVHYLAEAKALGDRLIVGVNDDASVRALKGPGRPVNPTARRLAVLAGLESVDWVVPFSEDTPMKLIEKYQPDVLVKGGDYSEDEIVGADFVKSYGGKVTALSFVDGLSTSRVIEKVKEEIA